MHEGKLVFAQVTGHLPLTTFGRCVARYGGSHKIKSFSCLDQYLCMAFAQLTYRESLRDIEACLRAQQSKLYHMGIKSRVSRGALADANESRDWRIYADFAQSLIGIARRLYATEPFGVDLNDTVYALDASTIDLCLSGFPGRRFARPRQPSNCTLSWICVATFLRPAYQRWQTARRQRSRSVAARARRFLHHGSRLHRLRSAFQLHEAKCFFVIRAKSNLKAQRRYSHPIDRSTGLICDQTVVLTGFYSKQDFDTPLRRVRLKIL